MSLNCAIVWSSILGLLMIDESRSANPAVVEGEDKEPTPPPPPPLPLLPTAEEEETDEDEFVDLIAEMDVIKTETLLNTSTSDAGLEGGEDGEDADDTAATRRSLARTKQHAESSSRTTFRSFSLLQQTNINIYRNRIIF
jgi:hypothetical protein